MFHDIVQYYQNDKNQNLNYFLLNLIVDQFEMINKYLHLI
jgi:hypothetical protein